MAKKKLGLIVNPVAGIGGAVGLKGSDGAEVQKLALQRGAVKKAGMKAKLALEAVLPLAEEFDLYAAPGEMGEDLAKSLGLPCEVVGHSTETTTPADTEAAARAMAALPVDVLLFAGGDGTARNVAAALGPVLPVVGVPAGVKIHSAVYACSPAAAGKALQACLSGTTPLREAEVMDIDEEEYRSGRLRARLYGYLSVPVLRGVMQNPKAASHNSADDVGGICEELKDRIGAALPGQCFIFGAGSTVTAAEKALGIEGTLLGIDIYAEGKLFAKDVAEKELLAFTKQHPCKLVITAIGGQGHIFGRGNQQLSPEVIRQIGPENIWVVAAASKIYSLPDQCLFVDTGDEELNAQLRGYRRVLVGWQETLVCEVR